MKMKEDKNKGRGKGKAIIGVALAAIMLVSIFGALAPTSARDGVGAIERGDVVFCGEKGLDVSAIIASGGIFYGMAGTTADGALITVPDNTSFNVPLSAKEGPYNVTNAEGTAADIAIDEPKITADVFIEGTYDSIVGKTIPAGTKLTIRVNTNFGGIMKNVANGNWSQIKIKLIDPDGIYMTKKIDANASEITVGPTAGMNDVVWDQLDTAWWDIGVWKMKITTDKATCNEVDVSSPEYEFTIRSSELSIDAVKEVVYKGEDIILTVTGYPKYFYYFAIENVTAWEEPHIKDTADIVSFGTGEGSPGAATAAWIKTGSDGIADIKICTYGADERIYTMHVYDTYHVAGAVPNETDEFAAPADVTGEKDEDEEKVKLEPVKVTFDIPSIVIIGEEVAIKGSVSGGDIVDILIEDGDVEYFNDEPVDENKEFEVDWDTVGLTLGSYRIDIYIDCLFDSFEEIEAAGIDPDGSTTIRLISYPYLDANLSKGTVPIGDSFEIYGNTSFDYVEIVTISPKGGNGTGMNGLYGVSIYTVPTFTEDTGSYKIHVFTNRTTSETTASEPLTIDGTTNRENGTIIIIKPGVTIDVPRTAVVGEDVQIEVTASAGDDVDIVIDDRLEFNDETLVNGEANVEWDTAGKTVGKTVGTYTIEVFVNCDALTSAMLGTNVSDEIDEHDLDADATATIRLIEPGLTVEQPKDEIARGSFYLVRGTATGVNEVDIAIIGPKGLTENRTGIEYGFELITSSVSENEFEDEIFIPEEAEEGEYTTFVLSPGRDCVYAATEFGGGELEDALEAQGYEVPERFVGKTPEQIIAMIKDATIEVAGSDDLYAMLTFRVTDRVTDALNNFYKKIKVDTGADTGNYTILVLSPGIDCVYGDSYYSFIDSILDLDGAGPELGAIDVSNMTQEEIISIIEDATINQAGCDDLIWCGNIVVTQFSIFDTGESSNPYPSISGTHNGTITPFRDINVSKLYTYPCTGTGGHTESIELYENDTLIANGTWNGYVGDWHNLTIHNVTDGSPYVTLLKKQEYRYVIKTGSYPQIIHAESKDVTGGTITCTSFEDANGKVHYDWIPAIRLE